VFPASLQRSLGERLMLSTPVESLTTSEEREAGVPGGFRLSCRHQGGLLHHTARAVVISTPAHAASALITGMAPAASGVLDRIVYPPVAEVFLGYRLEQCPRPLDGFGFLVPAREGRNILGTIWSSALFAGRAPAGHIALTTFVGGSRQPELLERSDAELLRVVREDLRSIMGIQGEPVIHRIARWARAIPQYAMGYQDILDGLERCEREVPGVFFCANFRGGIAVGDCLMSAKNMAGRVREFVHTHSVSTTER